MLSVLYMVYGSFHTFTMLIAMLVNTTGNDFENTSRKDTL